MSKIIALVPADLVTSAVKERDTSLLGVILTDFVEGEVPDLAADAKTHPHNIVNVRFGDGSGRYTETIPFPRDKITLILKTV